MDLGLLWQEKITVDKLSTYYLNFFFFNIIYIFTEFIYNFYKTTLFFLFFFFFIQISYKNKK